MYADGMVQIGTIWWPSLNVFTGLFFACLAAHLAVALLCSSVSKFGDAVKNQIRVAGVLVTFMLVLPVIHRIASPDGFSSGVRPNSHPNADAFAVVYQFLAFGFGFSLSCLRTARLRLQGFGIVFSFFFWGVIVWEAGCRAARTRDFSAVGVVIATCAWLVWVPIAIELASRFRERHTRRQRGLCERCGYDLRGNTSGRCPECGAGNVQDR